MGTYGEINLGYDWGKKRDIGEVIEDDVQDRGWKIKLGKGGLSFNHKGKREEETVEDDVQERGIHISGSASHSSSGGTHGQINSHYNHKFGGRDLEEIEDEVQDRGFHVSGGVSHSSHGGTYGEITLGYDWGKKRDIGEKIEDDVQDRGWKIKLGKGGLSFNNNGKRGLEKRKKSGFYVEGGGRYGSHTGAYGQINVGYEWGKRDLEKRKKSGFYVEGGGRYGSHTGAYGQI